jgi:hypothetical protein
MTQTPRTAETVHINHRDQILDDELEVLVNHLTDEELVSLEKAGMRVVVFDINKLKEDQQSCNPPAHMLYKLLHTDAYSFDTQSALQRQLNILGKKGEDNGL